MSILKTAAISAVLLYTSLVNGVEIHDATRSGVLEAVKQLVQAGSDVNDIDYIKG